MLKEWVSSIFGTGMLETALNTLTNNNDGNVFSVAWTAAQTAYDALVPFGIALVVFYFCASLTEMCIEEQVSLASLTKRFITLIIACMVMMNGWEILTWISDVGIGLAGHLIAKKFEIANSNFEVIGTTFTEQVEKASFPEAIGYYASLIFPYLVSRLTHVVVMLVAYSRTLTLCMMCAFAPIGVADLFHGGINSAGFRYLKKVCGVSLQATVIVILIYLVCIIQDAAYAQLNWFGWGDGKNNLIEATWVTVIINLTLISLIQRSQQLANDVIGV